MARHVYKIFLVLFLLVMGLIVVSCDAGSDDSVIIHGLDLYSVLPVPLESQVALEVRHTLDFSPSEWSREDWRTAQAIQKKRGLDVFPDCPTIDQSRMERDYPYTSEKTCVALAASKLQRKSSRAQDQMDRIARLLWWPLLIFAALTLMTFKRAQAPNGEAAESVRKPEPKIYTDGSPVDPP
jgi:hypothetical protein